jgi:hypothetical protein
MNPEQLRREPCMTQDDWNKAIVIQYEDGFKDTLDKHVAQIEAETSCIRELQISMQEGDIPTREAIRFILIAEENTAEMTKERVIMQANRYKMKEMFLDIYLESEATDMACVNAMLVRYSPRTENADRPPVYTTILRKRFRMAQ